MARIHRLSALLGVLTLAVTGCGAGGAEPGGAPGATGATGSPGAAREFRTGLDTVKVADPVRGGQLVYGLEADVSAGLDTSKWYCGPACRTIAKTIYDPLTVVDSGGTVRPYLAESVEPNADRTEWTIKVRPGIRFHDGTPLDAAAVVTNLEKQRTSPLNTAALAPVASVTADGPMSVRVKMKGPSSAFNVWLSTPIGYIMAPSMLAAKNGAHNPVGTGPFRFVEWKAADHLTVERNAEYWQKGLPYLDRVVFRPNPDVESRVAALRAGDIDVMHTDSADQIAKLRGDTSVRLVESELFGESNYFQLNVKRAPMNDVNVRRALAMALDRDAIGRTRNRGVTRVANGPFPPGTPGYLDNTGYPGYDPAAARAIIEKYEAANGPISLKLMIPQSPTHAKTAQVVQQMWKEVGVDVALEQVEFNAFLERDRRGDYDMTDARLFGGADPDLQRRWWHSSGASPVGNISDPQVDAALDVIRSSTDPAQRKASAEQLNRRLGDQVNYLWVNWTVWAVAAKPDVVGLNLQIPGGGQAGLVLGDHWLTYASRKR
ncbi:ABC transporter substrate-binding protein [Rhizohabitans arisaemae]|uniref:ABC transporter substrate-binding protein n=1 Tax=Rhizohabitans arisaemae TaxID=2720610 RepID=UPI0024B06479|nr:ABC transporter substrate-binding protein [Rhizohabitans arisaemae]